MASVKTVPNQPQPPAAGALNPATKLPSTPVAAAAVTASPNMSAQSSTSTASSATHPKAAKLVPFLRKVQILCETSPPEIARWSADGKQFDVLDPKGFDDLLKIHFEGAAPATFHRQLFFYGWVKLNHSNGGGDERTKGTWSFRHPSFLRDEPSKIYEIKRYARASDREEQEDGSRVDILERRVSALQSLVDDLSRKLAAVQLTLDRAPSDVPSSKPVPGRKRVKDVASTTALAPMEEDDFLMEELRLSEDDIMNLFEGGQEPFLVEEPGAMQVAPVKPMPQSSASVTSEEQAKLMLNSVWATADFHKVIASASLASQHQHLQRQQADKPNNKVESIPHLSVC
jgi:hypothetical protein